MEKLFRVREGGDCNSNRAIYQAMQFEKVLELASIDYTS